MDYWVLFPLLIAGVVIAIWAWRAACRSRARRIEKERLSGELLRELFDAILDND